MGKKAKKTKPAAGGDDDLDALLGAYRSKADESHKIETAIISCVPPRANAAVAAGGGCVWFHGGECFKDDETETFGDLYFYDTKGKTFNEVKIGKSANTPRARCGHQGVHIGNNFFVFGGEYTSKNGIDIFHLGDLWRLDCTKYHWSEVSGSVKLPTPRSGHRMAKISESSFAVFGGYHDTGRGAPKKFSDVFVFEVNEKNDVTSTLIKTSDPRPKPRSGACFSYTNGMLCLYGGSDAQGAQLSDMWVLPLPPKGTKESTWQQVSFTSNGLTPRVGLSMTVLPSGDALFFGGLSEIKDKKTKKKKVTQYRDCWLFDMKQRTFSEIPNIAFNKSLGTPSERMSAAIVCPGGDSLFLFGGVLEVAKGQNTLGDFWKGELVEKSGDKSVHWTPLSEVKAVLGCDSSSDGDSECDSEGVDDEQTDDELPFGYGVEEPMRVCRRLQSATKGAVGQFNSWHYSMMNDTDRNSFYQSGLEAAFTNQKKTNAPTSVFDIGSGAGLLTLISAKLGADSVTGCEIRTELCDLANSLIVTNDFDRKKVTVKNKLSTKMAADDFASPPTVIVHELFGALLLGERSLKFVSDARLKYPIKEVVPSRGVQYATLIYSEELEQITEISTKEGDRLGLDLRDCNGLKDTCSLYFTKSMGINMGAVTHSKLSERVAICDVNYLTDTPESVALESLIPLKITAAGKVTAVLLTWEAFNSSSDAALSTEPGVGGSQRAAAWGQAYQLIETLSADANLPQPVVVSPDKPASLCVRFSPDLSTLQCEVLDE